MTKPLSRFRIIVNLIGTGLIGAFCVLVGVSVLAPVLAGPSPRDPESALLVLALGVFTLMVGAFSALSCWRSWRALRQPK